MFAYIFKRVQKHRTHGKLHAQLLTFTSSGSEIVERSWSGYISVSSIEGEKGDQVEYFNKKNAKFFLGQEKMTQCISDSQEF